VIASLAFAVPLRAEEKPSVVPTVIRGGKLFDPVSGRLLDSPVVLIFRNHIEAVGSRDLGTPANARTIDLGSATLLPGFIDVHTHLTFDAGGGGYESLGISTPRAALTAAKNARLTLLAGFTTVRNLGAEGYADVALRDAIESGDVVGAAYAGFRPAVGHYRRTLRQQSAAPAISLLR
jgi:imidazolonepropionase-like amidohydrolase